MEKFLRLSLPLLVSSLQITFNNDIICPSLPPRSTPPTTIHDLRIDDIQLIMALGDSVTAAFAAKSDYIGKEPWQKSTIENRGISWSMGDGDQDDDIITLPKLMRQHNPTLQGMSSGDHLAQFCQGYICPGKHVPENDHLNAALSGSFASNLNSQLDYLIDQLSKSYPSYETDWKLLTLFVGGNDLCASCTSVLDFFSADAYQKHIRHVLDRIKGEIPRTMVNLVGVFNLSQIYDLTRNDSHCQSLRRSGFVFECTCAFLGVESIRREMDELAVEYNRRLHDLVLEFRASPPHPTFAVIMDPGFSESVIRDWPMSYMSKLDCFHPSAKTHSLFAVSLWNNLFRSWQYKSRSLEPDAQPHCPGEHDRIRTN